MRIYTSLAGARKASTGGPIVRLGRGGESVFLPVATLDTQVEVFTADSPDARHQSAGAVSLQDIVDAELVRETGQEWPGLRLTPDAANPNNVRITCETDRHVCKVYGQTPGEAHRKASTIMAALTLLVLR